MKSMENNEELLEYEIKNKRNTKDNKLEESKNEK